jgi:hypothetical protein
MGGRSTAPAPAGHKRSGGALHEIERKSVASTKDKEPRTEICRPASGQDCTALLRITNSHEWHAMFWYTPQAPVTPGRNIHLEVTAVTEVAGLFTYERKNYLVVHAGEQPLPRFSAASLYGDFHYHSQMTDNEGESAYSYRNVARALGALGFDFVFATDHASNGEQVDGKLSAEFCAVPRAATASKLEISTSAALRRPNSTSMVRTERMR